MYSTKVSKRSRMYVSYSFRYIHIQSLSVDGFDFQRILCEFLPRRYPENSALCLPVCDSPTLRPRESSSFRVSNFIQKERPFTTIIAFRSYKRLFFLSISQTHTYTKTSHGFVLYYQCSFERATERRKKRQPKKEKVPSEQFSAIFISIFHIPKFQPVSLSSIHDWCSYD